MVRSDGPMARAVLDRLDPATRLRLKRAVRSLPGRRARWGTLGRGRLFSERYGLDRGVPADRPLIEGFLDRHRLRVRGHVLEVMDDAYARRFGEDRVERVTVVDVDAGNPHATLVGDLDDPELLPAAAYDAVVLTQTLQYLRPHLALPGLWRSLRPGGALLLTVPCASSLVRDAPDADLLRLTPAGLRRALQDHCPGGEVVVEALGGLADAVAVLYGLAADEVPERARRGQERARCPALAAGLVVKPS